MTKERKSSLDKTLHVVSLRTKIKSGRTTAIERKCNKQTKTQILQFLGQQKLHEHQQRQAQIFTNGENNEHRVRFPTDSALRNHNVVQPQ